MEKSDIFQAADTENLNKVIQLKEEDLKQTGIKLVRHWNEMKSEYQGYNKLHCMSITTRACMTRLRYKQKSELKWLPTFINSHTSIDSWIRVLAI